jgi:hypothetical protein
MATVENCSLADRMDRVYEKNFILCPSNNTEQQGNYSQYYQYMN